jgi:hypothetical protein
MLASCLRAQSPTVVAITTRAGVPPLASLPDAGALLTAKLGTDFRPCVCAAAPMVMRLDDGSAARWYVELEVQTVPRDAAYLGVARPALAQAVAIEEGEDYGAEDWQQEEEGMERWGVSAPCAEPSVTARRQG